MVDKPHVTLTFTIDGVMSHSQLSFPSNRSLTLRETKLAFDKQLPNLYMCPGLFRIFVGLNIAFHSKAAEEHNLTHLRLAKNRKLLSFVSTLQWTKLKLY